MSIYNDICMIEQAIDEVLAGDENGNISLDALDTLMKTKSETIKDGLEVLCKVRANKLAMIEACKNEATRLTEKAKAEARRLDRLESYMLDLFDKSGESKVEAGTFTVGSRKSVSVYTEEGFDIDEFMRVKTTREPDKTLIKEALASGRKIDGASLVEKKNLSVR